MVKIAAINYLLMILVMVSHCVCHVTEMLQLCVGFPLGTKKPFQKWSSDQVVSKYMVSGFIFSLCSILSGMMIRIEQVVF